MKFLGPIRRIIAAYYWAAYSLHHKLFLRPGRPLKNSRLFVIGSFRAGGAGKTPFCLWLAERLAARGKRVAILCHKKAFDEILMYRHRLKEQIQQGQVEVISTDNRYRTARELDRRTGGKPEKNSGTRHPKVSDFILCDDGFEDSRLRPDVIFRMDWEKAPTAVEQLIPAGHFRSLRQDHYRSEDRTIAIRCFGTNPDVLFNIDSIANCNGDFPQHRQSIVVCGLGDPERFIHDLKRAEFIPQKTILRPDHDRNFSKILTEILRQNFHQNIVLSEKDAFRLPKEILKDPKIFIARQTIQVYGPIRDQINRVLAK